MKKVKPFYISENSVDVMINNLRKKGLLKKENKEYVYINPFSKILEIKDKQERELEMYKLFIKMISPYAKYKPMEILREAMYKNNKNKEVKIND